jgi:D-alanyl-D-alanine carboxypeptidase
LITRRLQPLSALLVALSLVVFGAAAAARPAPVQAAGALPQCRYDDLATAHASTGEWRITLLDTIYKVPSSYRPPGLVSTSKAGLNKGGYVRRVALADLTDLARAARNAGNPLRVVSAYRSYSVQRALFNREVRTKGLTAARESVARPGHSEHQLGTTIDFGSANSRKKGWHYSDWAQTSAGSWLKANGWRFGFVMSYPKNRKGVTCYRYEPWHWRYVGREMAADVRASGLTLREYLWRHYH